MDWREWDEWYTRSVLPLYNLLNWRREVLGNDVLNAIRSLQNKGGPVTSSRVSEILMSTRRPWDTILLGNAYSYLDGVIEYYLKWDELPKETKRAVQDARLKDRKSITDDK